MMVMTYPDGTQELHDGGLELQVQRGKIVSATLRLVPDQTPVPVAVELGDRQHIGYVWQKRVRQKWAEQMAGLKPLLTENSGAFWVTWSPECEAGR